MYRETVSTRSSQTIGTQLSATCRFSETEAVPILSLIIARYRVEVQNEPQFASETFEQKRERILTAETRITTTWVYLLCCNKPGLIIFDLVLSVYLWSSRGGRDWR